MNVFLSYTRIKNDLDKSVTKFHTRLLNELKIRNPKANIFFDEKNISVGTDFSKSINDALEVADIFMPIISPAWLASKWCRKEFNVFINTRDGRADLVFPILWVNTGDFNDESTDEITRYLARKQYRDWGTLRLLEDDNPEVRTASSELAENLDTFLNFKTTFGSGQGISVGDFSHVLSNLENKIATISPEETQDSPILKSVVRSVWDAVDKTSQHLNKIRSHEPVIYEPSQELIEAWNTAAMNLTTFDKDLAYLLRAKATFWSDPASWNDKEIEHADIRMTNLRKVALNLIDRIGT